MKRSSRPRATAELSKSLNRQLSMYALAASAAGLGLLASAQPAEAKIVYTPAHVRIGGHPFPLDINRDGVVDFFIFSNFSHFGDSRRLQACQTVLSGGYGIGCSDQNGSNGVRVSMRTIFAAALHSGVRIQRGDHFSTRGNMGDECCFTSSNTMWRGPWFNGGKGVKNRYLGMKFKIRGRFHFGWARITVTTTSNNFTATLTGYAYETVPGKAIVAGKTKGPDVTTVSPASLGHLAAGVSAIPAWRSGM